MKQNFSELFEIIKNKFILEHGGKDSLIALSEFLGHGHKGKVTAWSKGQWPSTQDCWVLHEKLGFNLEWLLTGNAEVLDVDSRQSKNEDNDNSLEPNQKSSDFDDMKLRIANLEQAIGGALPTSALRPIPLIGFAACGTEGWGGTMTYEVPITPPHPRPDMIAIVASGDSMLPEGIGNGHICFCDPHAPPMPGECVYIEQTDGKAALKRFLGECHIKGSGAGIELRYWRRKEGKLIEHNLQLAKFFLKTIAPVIYVQRRV